MVIRSGCCDEGGGSSVDRFAPKYLVGNVLNGDTAPASSSSGFVYFADPGDGTGIAAALAAAGVSGGDVWIRPGVYTLGARLTVPTAVLVRGSGLNTQIVCGSADHCAFAIGDGVTLRDMYVRHTQAGAAVGTAIVEGANGAPGIPARVLANLTLQILTGNAILPFSLVGGSSEIASCYLLRSAGVGLGPLIEGGAGNPASFDMHNCTLEGFTTSILSFGAAAIVGDARISDNRFLSGAGVIPIVAGANADGCIAMGNASRGSGSTLPTDVGTNNSIAPGVANYWGP